MPAVTISFDLRPGVALSQAIGEINAATTQMQLPATLIGTFQGTAQAFQSSLQGMGILLALAVFIIYLVLGILYESFIHPVTILSGLPTAGFGALVTLIAFGSDLNMYAFVGIIMLIGIVKKNAILMVDFAIEARAPGRQIAPRTRSSRRASTRFRPIMMTTMAALMGSLPIALALGAGGDIAAPARPRRRRRPRRIAAADALHHAGRLHLLRAVSAVGLVAAARGPPGTGERCCGLTMSPRR